jgi:MFS family permease
LFLTGLFFVDNLEMIETGQSLYYFAYGVVCLSLGISYLRLKSGEGTVITTKEFQSFQNSFVGGYACILFCEFIAAASFYHTLIDIHLELEHITRLYLVTVISTTLASIALEIVDVGTRKDKCVLSAILYSVSMFAMFFGGHYEMLLMGRIVYGTATALQQAAFESYAIHQHSSHGFPEDWLSHTFTLLTHILALMAALSGVVGQIAASFGHNGCIAVCTGLFAFTALYLTVMWEKDVNTPRFMLSGFMFNLNQASTVLRSNKNLSLLLLLASLCEASITIFTFYWAPWLSGLVAEEDTTLPYEIVFSSFIGCSMFGNYLFQMMVGVGSSTSEQMLQSLLIAASVAYFCGAIFQTPFLAFAACLVIQIGVGIYWPCIGYYRGRIIPHDLRNIVLVIQKVVTLLVTMVALHFVHDSPILMLSTCSVLNAMAAYVQYSYLDSKVLSQLANDDDDDDDTSV